MAITLDDSAGWVALQPQIPQVTIYAKVRDPKGVFQHVIWCGILQNKGFLNRLLISASPVTIGAEIKSVVT